MTLEGHVPRARWPLMAVVVAFSAGILIASFLKSDLTHNDFERFEDLRLTFLFFGLLGAACLAYAALWMDRPPLSAGTVVAGAAVAGLLLFISFPVGSKDAFLYAFFGKVWGTYHTNPYVAPPAAFIDDAWQPYVQVIWAKQPAPYGPLFLWQTRLVDAIAHGNLFASVWTHKAIATLALAGCIALGARLMAPAAAAERWYRIALLAWNPLLLFESAGNGHNDAVMALLVLAALWLHRRGGVSRGVLAPAALAAGVWYKWYAVLFLPAFLVAVRRGERRRWLMLVLVTIAVSGVLLLAPLADAVPLVVHRLAGYENLREVFPLQLSPLLAALHWGLERAGVTGGPWTLTWFDAARGGAFALVAVIVLLLQMRGSVGLVESTCALSVAFTMLVITILWPWHLEVPVILGLVAGTPGWSALAVTLTLLGVLSYFFTFAWAAALLVVLAGALFILRRGWFSLPIPDAGPE